MHHYERFIVVCHPTPTNPKNMILETSFCFCFFSYSSFIILFLFLFLFFKSFRFSEPFGCGWLSQEKANIGAYPPEVTDRLRRLIADAFVIGQKYSKEQPWF
jgi:hypothetical protein